MKMKEVCEKTGLTDRAVRLYIDSGLLSPATESNYAGRRSLDFNERDVRALEAVATLRRADFSIPDIRLMQESPERIPEILAKQKQSLRDSAENRLKILASLETIPQSGVSDYLAVADSIHRSVSPNTIPKEDSFMQDKDLKDTMTRRIFPFFATLFLLFNLISFTPMAVKTLFAEAKVLAGGGYTLDYHFTLDRFLKGLPLLAAWLILLSAFILLIAYLFSVRRFCLTLSLIGLLAAIAILLLLPSDLRNALYSYEFLAYRYSFLHRLYWSVDDVFDVFLMSLKLIPIVLAAVLTGVGLSLDGRKI